MKKYFVLCLIFGFSLFLASCAEQEDMRPKRDCPIKQLLLDQSDYPPDSIFDAIQSPIADKPLESAGQSAYYQDSWTDQSVVRYFSNDNAIAEYDKVQKIVFDPDEVVGLWETPSILTLDNLSADRHEIACGNVVSFGKRCYMIGQYEEYYVFFRADISNNGVTHELFRDLVLKIDDRMSACVSQ
ncbi:MAG: hypothetical protein L6Q49_15895 [Anaerolineales bacterium]|nr:hypothetical protein [Anaerolineales bacterium]